MIGVILAFLVSRIINEGGDYDRLSLDSKALIDESIDLKNRLDSMDFEWHIKSAFEAFNFRKVDASLKALANSSSESKIKFIRNTLPCLYYPEKFVSEIDKLINYAPAMHELPFIEKTISRSGNWEHINEFEKEFDNISLRVRSVVRRHKAISKALTNNKSDMQSLSIAILALAPITLLTVIYPLHFLPVPDGASPSIKLNIFNMLRLLFSIKGFFLVVLSILTVGLLLVLVQGS
jgi:hypothetical protein